MSDLGGPSRISGGPAAVLGAGGAPAQVMNPPPRMMQLAVGHSLKGVVLTSETPGQILVRTEQGTLTLRTAQVPAPGTRVTLQIRHIGTELSVMVFPDRQAASPGNQALQTAPRTAQPNAPAPAPASALPVAAQQDSFSLGHLYSGQVESRSPLPAGSTELPAAGTALLLRILRLNPGQELDEVVRTLPREFTAAEQLAKGRLVEQTPNGQSLVRTDTGMLRIDQLPKLPSGTLLLLALSGNSGIFSGQGPAAISFNSWPALAALLQQNAGQDKAHTGLPQPGPGLAGEIASFLAGLKQNHSKPGWLAALYRLLPQESHKAYELSERLGRDVEWLRQLSAKSDSEGWRFFLIPLLEERQVTYLRLHVRGEETKKEQPAEARQPARFVLDIDFEVLGALQLDGLLARQSFDVILRSRMPLDPGLQDRLNEILLAAGATSGLECRLSFHSGTDWFPLPPPSDALRGEVSA